MRIHIALPRAEAKNAFSFMKERSMGKLALRLISSSAVAAAFTIVTPAHAVHGGEGMQWGDAPPMLQKGAKLAVLQGDPSKPGPFVMRLKVPAGYKVMPHNHSQAENVTVISGNFQVGMGDKWDAKTLKTFHAGDFGSIPAKTNHYAMAKSAAVIQIHGEGPFDLNYVNPSDDPSKGAAKSQ
jgi:quercetin dioxygenase-like cupin family protein